MKENKAVCGFVFLQRINRKLEIFY